MCRCWEKELIRCLHFSSILNDVKYQLTKDEIVCPSAGSYNYIELCNAIQRCIDIAILTKCWNAHSHATEQLWVKDLLNDTSNVSGEVRICSLLSRVTILPFLSAPTLPGLTPFFYSASFSSSSLFLSCLVNLFLFFLLPIFLFIHISTSSFLSLLQFLFVLLLQVILFFLLLLTLSLLILFRSFSSSISFSFSSYPCFSA